MASSLQQYSWLTSPNTISSSSSKSTTCKHFATSFKPPFSAAASSSSGSEPSPEKAPESPVDPVKAAFEKAKAYKNLAKSSSKPKTDQSPLKDSAGGFKQESKGVLQNETVEKADKKKKLTISSIDFVGLNFADKKIGRGLPAGLTPVEEQFSEGDLSEVEIIVGDAKNFGDNTKTSESETVREDNSDLYKPKVSTWGVFPRPGNISKTFGGGKVIRPGDVLETEEDRAAKDERTRQLVAAYKKKAGLTIDQKLKSECEKALQDGDRLMDSGKLKEALPYYEKVIDKLPFKSDLHGLAALQWSICLDSLNRSNEAQVMYRKLRSHPNVKVSKRAREFAFSFQAMEMMKFNTSSSSSSRNTGYQNYFEAFIDDRTNISRQESELEGTLNQALPYVIFLISPIVMVLVIAVQKGNIQ
ncbi:uncharacterized protein [Rutidosis leptorrhynchoides]|uniref:uncharacterized protein n=1 Tax=Rutidosis leptorrhynchoides TaxID=125765 RepID=UPI003A9A61FC